MGRIAPLVLTVILGLSDLGCALRAEAQASPPLQIFAPPGDSKGLVLYLSDSSPDRALIDRLKQLTYTVAAVNAEDEGRQPAQSPCRPPAQDVKAIVSTLKYRIPALQELPPILLGTGSGAQRVYRILTEAAAGDFHAGISLDFCPPEVPADCAAPPAPTHLPANWYVFQGAPGCDPSRAARFIGRIDNAKLVDHSAAADASQKLRPDLAALLQWLDPGISGQAAATGDVAGVPLTEVRAGASPSPVLAILLSGDGGWAAIDRGIAGELAKQGVDTVGWDSLSYFWNAKTPEQAAADLERVIAHYSRTWNKSGVMLIGYSFGADALPFIITRLSPDTRKLVRLAAFLGLGLSGSLEFHLSDWLGGDTDGQWPTRPEVVKLRDIPRLCIYGAEETDSGCPGLEKAGVRVVKVGGDHHFDEAYGLLAGRLLQALP
jgi:type IV secretory pathway VirJ component